MALRIIDWQKFWNEWANFQDKQKEAEAALDNHDYLLYGGAAGGGKSYFLRKYPIRFLHYCFRVLGLRGVRTGLFCEDYPTLWDRHINRLPYEFPKELGEYKAQSHEFVLPAHHGGGVIAFRNLDDPSKYMSSEFALIGVDEITKNKRETFDFLRMRLRWTGVEHPKFIATSNPGGIGHEWVKRLWIDRKFDSAEKHPEQFHFVRAKATDNKFLSQSYYEVLDSLPEKMRKAYRDGNWDVFEGQFFTEWDNERHACKPFLIPENWKRYRSYDHGRSAPACCKWYAVDEEGRVYAYRELYQREENVDQLAAKINDLSKGEEYVFSVADPSIFHKQGMVDKYGGQTIAETFSHNGIQFYPASNRRVDGWALLHQYFHWSEDKKPKFIYFDNCANSIRTIPSLIYDSHNPEDLDTDGEDHAADCDRYFLMALHEKRSPEAKNEIQKKLDEWKKASIVRPENLNDFYIS